MKKILRKVAIAAALVGAALGMPAMATPTPAFSVDTALFEGGSGVTFDANFISGQATSLLQITGPSTIIGHGFNRFSSFSDAIGPLLAGDTHLQLSNTSGYFLWAEYSYVTTHVSGPFAAGGSTYSVNTLTFTLFGEAANGSANNSTFVNADTSNPATSALVTHSADTKTLGSGVLNSGVATINTQLGTSFNANMDFTLTVDGMSFFYAPDPFYTLAFTSFTNTTGGFTPTPEGYVAINNANGGADFNNVPEPGSLALLGLGLLGLAAARRRAVK